MRNGRDINFMTKEYFTELAEFNSWANDIVHGWLNQISDEQWSQTVVSSFPSIAETILHLASAERAWYDRFNNGGEPVEWLASVFKGTRTELMGLWKQASLNLKDYISSFEENKLKEELTFRRINGEENTMPYYQMFAHVINHSTFHRGQLVTMLRQAGFTGVSSTDMLGFFRRK